MKARNFVPFFVAAVVAQGIVNFGQPNCGVVNKPVSSLISKSVQTIGQALQDINGTVATLNDTINAFKSGVTGDTILNLEVAAQGTIAAIVQGNSSVAAADPIPNTDEGQGDAIDLTSFITSLACAVNSTVANFIEIKQAIINACLGPIAFNQITVINNDAIAFNETTNGKLPAGLRDEASGFVNPIIVALASGVSAYADATSQPASCTPSSTTTVAATTVSSTATGTSSGGSSQTTSGSNGGVYPTTTSDECEDETTTTGGVYPTGGQHTTTEGGSYPTGAQYTTTDDCEDDTTTGGGSYPTGVGSPTGAQYTTTDDCEDDTTTGGGSYPTGVSNPTSVKYTTTEDCEDDTTTGGGSNPTGVTYSLPGVIYTTGVTYTLPGIIYTTGGAHPTGGVSSYTSKAPTAPVYTSKAAAGTTAPAYTTGPVATYTTGKNPISTYAGAAPTNGANGLGMIAAIAAAALLL